MMDAQRHKKTPLMAGFFYDVRPHQFIIFKAG
jgi:hypothetical protein